MWLGSLLLRGQRLFVTQCIFCVLILWEDACLLKPSPLLVSVLITYSLAECRDPPVERLQKFDCRNGLGILTSGIQVWTFYSDFVSNEVSCYTLDNETVSLLPSPPRPSSSTHQIVLFLQLPGLTSLALLLSPLSPHICASYLLGKGEFRDAVGPLLWHFLQLGSTCYTLPKISWPLDLLTRV